MTTPSFDMEAVLQALREGKDGILTPLIKALTEAAMKAELDQHLSSDDQPNGKNGPSDLPPAFNPIGS